MSKVKILVVEDEAIVAEDIASRLENKGYEVVDILATGEEAIAIAKNTQPHLILMDIILQGEIDGVEAAREIYSEIKIPVVYLTANADDKTINRAQITQPFGYILKPFKEKELFATIEIALSRHQVEVEAKKELLNARALQKEAESQNERKSQQLSMAFHEIRNPLCIIKTSSELLEDKDCPLTEEVKQKHLHFIQNATNKMQDILEDILTFGKLECDKFTTTPTPLELLAFCQQLVDTIQMTSGEKYTLNCISSHSQIQACLDDRLLWLILNNLLSNAIKYSPKGGIVSLNISATEELVSFQVSDRGIGISQEDLQNLFEPFQRAKNVGKIPGTGLGLAIVKRLVELQNGQILVDSELRKGTTFTVTLPLHSSFCSLEQELSPI
jgi:signal transduction histidine kinase